MSEQVPQKEFQPIEHKPTDCCNLKDAKPLISPIPYKPPVTENLISFIRNGLRRSYADVVIIDPESDRHWTGHELEHRVAAVSLYLVNECFVKKGDVCTVYAPVNDHTVIVILAIIAAGAVSNFITDKYKPRECVDTSKAIKAKHLISTKDLLEQLKQLSVHEDESLHVISCDQACEGYINGCRTIDHLFAKSDPPEDVLDDGLDVLIDRITVKSDVDFAVIQFSSGTTGKPKPIPRTHKNLCHLAVSVKGDELMDLKHGEVIAGSLPITHRPGLWALLACIHSGSTFVLFDSLSNVAKLFELVQKYKVTILSSSLPFLSTLGNVGISIKDKYDLSSLKHIITSGAKIVNADLPKTIVAEFNLKTLRQCFGMTECGWVFLIEKSLAKDNYLTVGHVCPGMQAVVLDRETLKPVETDACGEIALKGPQIFPGYLTDVPGVFNRSDFTDDGWFRTGDQGFYDSRELVFIEGRYKELIIFENNGRFFPNEIESVIKEHPAIEEACVVKIGEFKSTHTYDIAKAFVSLKLNCSMTEDELMDFIKERSFEITLEGGIKILESFPRLQNGKIDKQTLKDMK